jgi:hypothetical protein
VNPEAANKQVETSQHEIRMSEKFKKYYYHYKKIYSKVIIEAKNYLITSE